MEGGCRCTVPQGSFRPGRDGTPPTPACLRGAVGGQTSSVVGLQLPSATAFHWGGPVRRVCESEGVGVFEVVQEHDMVLYMHKLMATYWYCTSVNL